jgi:hypothetical protein
MFLYRLTVLTILEWTPPTDGSQNRAKSAGTG